MNYRNTYSWQMTVELAAQLARLADDLPASEERGLKQHLLGLVVDLPAAVGLDLGEENGVRRREQVIKLQACLAVVEVIYPAIDVSEVAGGLEKLAERLFAANFKDEIPEPEPTEDV